MKHLQISAMVLALASLSSSPAFAAWDLGYSGRITDSSGEPIVGSTSLRVQFYRAVAGGTPILSTPIDFNDIVLTEGIFQITLALSDLDRQTIFNGTDPAWIEITDTVRSVTYPRQVFGVVPYALKIPIDSKVLAYDDAGKLTLSAPPETGKFLSANAQGELVWVVGSSSNVATTATPGYMSATDKTNLDSVTTASTSWNTAYTERLQWDGSSVGNGAAQTAARSSIGLGSMATQSSSAVSITGGTINAAAHTNFASTGIDDNAAATAMTIDATGNVGIGTTSPYGLLDTGSWANHVSGNGYCYNGRTWNDLDGDSNRDNGECYRGLNVSSTTGYVGLGVVNPSATLHVQTEASGAGLRTGILVRETGLGTAAIGFAYSYGNASGSYMAAPYNAGYELSFGTGGNSSTTGTERIRIDRNGNVGIGTTAPVAALQVANGQAVGTFVSSTTAAINWNSGNIQSTSVAAGTITFTTGSMFNGTGYTLILNNATGGTYTLASADVTTWKCLPTCTSNQISVTAGKDTVLTIIKGGTTAYVSWMQGF